MPPKASTVKKRASVAPVPAPVLAPILPVEAPIETFYAQLPQGFWRWLTWAFCLVPLVGLTFGLLFINHAQAQARRFARICLILAACGLMAMALQSCFNASGLDGGSSDDGIEVVD
jgi:hypothetical protein